MLFGMRETAMSAIQGLRRGRVALLGLVAGFIGCLGCESAHYVMRSPDRGVVAIPEDTPQLRAKAEKLMHEQFPGGYVIEEVRVTEVGRAHHPHEEVMLYYHAAPPISAGAPVVSVATPPGPIVMPHVQPASLTVQPASPTVQPASPTVQPALQTVQPGDLPPQPIPVNAR
jgi:hypothetical protein